MIVYPRSTGSGIKACPWIETVCTLAGISDIGVKASTLSLACCFQFLTWHSVHKHKCHSAQEPGSAQRP